jgi:hypothetical protein
MRESWRAIGFLAERNLTIQSIRAIARALDLKISELFRGVDQALSWPKRLN